METKHGKLPGNPHEEKPLDPELKNYYVDIKRNIKQDHTTYISSHPEIRQLLNDFMSTLLLHKPEDVFKFTKDYYSFFNKKQDGTTEVQTKKKPPRTEIKPIIMIGPSGVGKGTIVDKLVKDFPNRFEFSVSYTTRAPKDGEENGKNYFFVSKEEFEKRIKENDFLESSESKGHFYGMSKSYIESIKKKGKICILDIDLTEAENLVHKGFDANIVFFIPPSVQALRERLINRGVDSADSIESRINKAKSELEAAPQKTFIDKRIVNDDLEKCYGEVKQYLGESYPSLKF